MARKRKANVSALADEHAPFEYSEDQWTAIFDIVAEMQNRHWRGQTPARSPLCEDAGVADNVVELGPR
jgi:hypothetical protein